MSRKPKDTRETLPVDSLIISPDLNEDPTLLEVAEEYNRIEKSKTPHKISDVTKSEIASNWNAFVISVQENGILESLVVYEEDGQYYVADGRHRLAAAKACELAEVPVEIVTKEVAAIRAEVSVQAKRQLPAGYRAYRAVMWHPEVVAEATGGGRKSLSLKSSKGLISFTKSMTQQQLADAYGVSQGLVSQAIKLYVKTTSNPKLRREHLAKLSGGYGVGALIAGNVEPDRNSGNKAATPASIKRNAAAFVTGMNAWTKWDEDEQLTALAEVEKQLERIETPALRSLVETFNGALESRDDAA